MQYGFTVHLPKFPIELYNNKFLSRLNSILGTMVKVDTQTFIHSRGKFVRISVEINLSQPLILFFTSIGQEQCLEYEGLHSIDLSVVEDMDIRVKDALILGLCLVL